MDDETLTPSGDGLVGRLRTEAELRQERSFDAYCEPARLIWQAADEIERMQAREATLIRVLRSLSVEMHDHARETKHNGAVWKESWTVVDRWADRLDEALATSELVER